MLNHRKKCIYCHKIKIISEFYKQIGHLYDVRSECKNCTKQRAKIYVLKHKKHVQKTKKLYCIKNREKILKKLRDYYAAHKIERKEYIECNRDKISKQYKIWYEKNKKKKAKYQIQRRKENINSRLSHCLRQRILSAIKLNFKSEHTTKLIGCSIEFLKQHIESKFKPGMTWKNYGTGWNGRGMQEWHIDHIIPCCSFDLSKASEQYKCFHYTNLQPLWASENRRKCRK